MPVTYRYKLHSDKVLWPEHKPLAEVVELQKTTPDYVWDTTYQGEITPMGGVIFHREWWTGNRYLPSDEKPLARWISFDTALSDSENSAKTALVVGELDAYYRMRIVECWQDRVQFPQLIEVITSYANKWNGDGLLDGVIIEDKASGISAVQTLRQSAVGWLAEKIITFTPHYSKETRWSQSAVWCKLGCVLLPVPNPNMRWLYDFEADLFEAPNIVYKDAIDAFAQLILFTENLISEGYKARTT